MRERHLCITFELRTNCFCQQRARLEVLIKVTLLKKIQLEINFLQNFFHSPSIYLLLKSLLSKLLTLPSADKKNFFPTLRLYTNDTLSSILFQPVTAWLFPTAAPFPVLSILTIPLDKCQMKSFENINILIEVQLFV